MAIAGGVTARVERRGLPQRHEAALVQRFRRGDAASGQAVVEAHMRFVIRCARGYLGYGIPLSDLAGEGYLGLLEALRRFEPERGHRFLTYAAYWVRAFILSYITRNWSLVRVGPGAMGTRLFFRLQRERARLGAALGADFDVEDELLARRFQTRPEVIRETTHRLEGHDASLQAPAFRDGTTTAQDLLLGEDAAADIEARDRDRRVRERMEQLLPRLSPRDREIVSRRLLDGEESLTALGARLGVTRERVRQLEARIKRTLQKELADLAEAL